MARALFQASCGAPSGEAHATRHSSINWSPQETRVAVVEAHAVQEPCTLHPAAQSGRQRIWARYHACRPACKSGLHRHRAGARPSRTSPMSAQAVEARCLHRGPPMIEKLLYLEGQALMVQVIWRSPRQRRAPGCPPRSALPGAPAGVPAAGSSYRCVAKHPGDGRARRLARRLRRCWATVHGRWGGYIIRTNGRGCGDVRSWRATSSTRALTCRAS